MEILLLIGATFLLCWLVDKGFHKLFRSKPQHVSGKAVRLSKYYALGGLILSVLGISATITGAADSILLLAGGIIVLLAGICMIVWYMCFGIFYDGDSFVLTTFGRKSVTYRYGQIRGQLLYNNRGHILVELHMTDGQAFHLQHNMTNVSSFLDTAYDGWCAQRGLAKEQDFHDPENSCWFPSAEV